MISAEGLCPTTKGTEYATSILGIIVFRVISAQKPQVAYPALEAPLARSD